MQLPKFQSQSGVSMDSARVSAARISTPSQIRPATQTFRPTQTAAQAAAVAGQPTGFDKLLNVGSELLKYAIEVDESKQDMALKAAEAEHKQHMAYWMADYESRKHQINEDTNRPYWETFEEDYNKASASADKMFRDKYRFGGKGREKEWQLNRNATDTNNRVHILGSVTKAKQTEGMAEHKIAAANATKIEELREINATAVKAGYILPVEAEESERRYLVNERFKMTMRTMDGQNMEQALAIREDMKWVNSPNAKSMTDTQRNEVSKAADQRIENIQRGTLNNIYHKSGEAAARAYVMNMQKAGPDATYTEGQESHDARVNALDSQLDQLIDMRKDMTEAQTLSTAVGTIFSPTTDPNNLADAKRSLLDSNVKKAVNAHTDVIIGNLREDGKSMASTEGAVLLNRFAHLDHLPKNAQIEIETILNDTTNKEGAAKELALMTGIMMENEKINPNLYDGLDETTKEKFDFYKAAHAVGRLQHGSVESVEQVEKDYDAYMALKQDPEQTILKSRTAEAKNLLDKEYKEFGQKGESIQTRYDRQAKQHGHDSRSGWSIFSSGPRVEADARAIYTENFTKYMQMYGNPGVAEKLAYEATRKQASGELISGNLETEFNGPSAKLGITAEQVQTQHEAEIENVNANRALANLPPIESTDTRRVYVGKRAIPGDPENETDTWLLVDKNNQLVMQPNKNGDMTWSYVQYEKVTEEEAMVSREVNGGQKLRFYRNQAEANIAKTGYELPNSGSYLMRDTSPNASMRDARAAINNKEEELKSATPASYDTFNKIEWERMSSADKQEATDLYKQVHRDLMEMMATQQRLMGEEVNHQDLDLMVRHFMATKGYKSGDENDEYISPPVLH
jgi:hypothetical protein